MKTKVKSRRTNSRKVKSRRTNSRKVKSRRTNSRKVKSRRTNSRKVKSRKVKSRKANSRKVKSRKANSRKVKSRKANSRKVKSRRAKSRRKVKYDGVGRFKLKYETIQNNLLNQLRKVENHSNIAFDFKIDFAKGAVYEELINQTDLSDIKNKLNQYIRYVQYSELCPKEELEKFRKRYLDDLKKIKEKLDEMESVEPEIPLLFRQESYEETPVIRDNLREYRHKTDTRRKRIILDDRIFDIVEE
jgi:hypothetical protein